jgi:hypothetical protein
MGHFIIIIIIDTFINEKKNTKQKKIIDIIPSIIPLIIMKNHRKKTICNSIGNQIHITDKINPLLIYKFLVTISVIFFELCGTF